MGAVEAALWGEEAQCLAMLRGQGWSGNRIDFHRGQSAIFNRKCNSIRLHTRMTCTLTWIVISAPAQWTLAVCSSCDGPVTACAKNPRCTGCVPDVEVQKGMTLLVN